MSDERFTIIEDGRATAIAAHIEGGRVRLGAEALEASLGWTLASEGLCRGDVCVPFPSGRREGRQAIALDEVTLALGRPLAVDLDERAAYVGVSAEDRRAALASLDAPDFSLPDLDGRLHSLREHRGRKVLLVAYASW